MSSLFGGNEIKKSQQQQQAMYRNMSKQNIKQATKWGQEGLGRIDAASTALQNSPAANLNLNFGTPGYGIQLNSSGGAFTRQGETQGVMDALLSGAATDEAGYNNLLSQIQPGFGRLSSATQQEIENASRAAVGNLREQLARRRVLGASFANDQMAGLKATYDQMKQKAMAESFVQEMEMTKQVISQRTEARNQAISQAFSQLNFEGDTGRQLTALIMANNNDMAKLQADLAATGAQIAAGIGQTIVAGNTTLGNTVLGSQPQYAELAANAQAGLPNLLGTVAGAALTGGLGGLPSLGGLASGGLMAAKSGIVPIE